ncbi:MAG: hypothetical protein M1826_002376 [Phylliscum demangeonii]|nr:MAG: hypothetical protein M1826_002376 [Phylliscum demangeonii]
MSSVITTVTNSAVLSRPEGARPAASKKSDATDDDFFWTYTEEPHRTRRQAIIKAHPEVTKLCGPEPGTKYLVLAVVVLQLTTAYLLRGTWPLSWRFLATAYVVGATANQNLFLAIHEISHNLAFRSPRANRLFALVANVPIAVPYSAAFRPYHLAHHKSLGVDGIDTDLPTAAEAVLLDSVLGKAFFCTFQIVFYALRPMIVHPLPLTRLHVLNLGVQLLFDALLVRYVGVNALLYLIASSFLAGSLHPCAGHFIAEHYVFDGGARPSEGAGAEEEKEESATSLPPPETYSYYGPLNYLTYNVGLHNEHHDFPAVPWTRLPAVRALAPEFYAHLPAHRSWVAAMARFIVDPDVGLRCRVKRRQAQRPVQSNNTEA